MKKIISKRSGKEQIVTEERWKKIQELGMARNFTVTDMPRRPLKDVPREIKPPKKKKNEQNN